MSILAILTTLLGSQWSTTCVMTQADLEQGYTIDTVQFQKEVSENSKSNELGVTFTRTWYKDENCTNPQGIKSTSQGKVSIGSRIAESTFEADWNMYSSLINTVQLGAIAYDANDNSIRMATTSFGNSRNTMLSLFRYFAK